MRTLILFILFFIFSLCCLPQNLMLECFHFSPTAESCMMMSKGHCSWGISVCHGDAEDAVASATLKNWPIRAKIFKIWAKYTATFACK